jgi:hypothetical protein
MKAFKNFQSNPFGEIENNPGELETPYISYISSQHKNKGSEERRQGITPNKIQVDLEN